MINAEEAASVLNEVPPGSHYASWPRQRSPDILSAAGFL
jgi:hypothetical protein